MQQSILQIVSKTGKFAVCRRYTDWRLAIKMALEFTVSDTYRNLWIIAIIINLSQLTVKIWLVLFSKRKWNHMSANYSNHIICNVHIRKTTSPTVGSDMLQQTVYRPWHVTLFSKSTFSRSVAAFTTARSNENHLHHFTIPHPRKNKTGPCQTSPNHIDASLYSHRFNANFLDHVLCMIFEWWFLLWMKKKEDWCCQVL